MNYKEIKREIELLESNIEYKKRLIGAVKSDNLLELTYRIKNVVEPGVIDVREGWGFLDSEIKQVLKKEIERTDEAIEGIAERLGTDVETLLKGTE